MLLSTTVKYLEIKDLYNEYCGAMKKKKYAIMNTNLKIINL